MTQPPCESVFLFSKPPDRDSFLSVLLWSLLPRRAKSGTNKEATEGDQSEADKRNVDRPREDQMFG